MSRQPSRYSRRRQSPRARPRATRPEASATERDSRGGPSLPEPDQSEADEHRGEAGDRHGGLELAAAARSRDHFRRRRFAGRDRHRHRIAAGQRRRERRRGFGPSRGIRIDASQNRALDGGIEAGDVGARTRRRRRVHFLEFVDVPALERALAGEELVEHEAERVEVGLHREFAAVELLGRHVLRRAGLRFAADDAGRRAGEAEVGDLRAAAAVDHDVGGFQIAMEHALVVRRRQARAELPRDLDGFVFRQPADAAEQRREILAVHELHRKKVASVHVCRCRTRGRRSDA